MSLELIHAFGIATRVGPPSLHRRRFGVPIGGAFDRESAALLKALLGLAEDAEVWELGLANATFRVPAHGTVGIVGAPCTATVDGSPRPTQGTFPVDAGSTVQILPPTHGARVYAGFQPGTGRARRLATAPSSLEGGPVRFVPGPQADRVDPDLLAGREFRIHAASNRVGLRLAEAIAEHAIELLSEPACVGTIQVTGGGQVILLGPDGPTIGGYPKVGVVIDADLDRIGQARPGDRIVFERVTIEEARAATKAARARLARWIAEIRAADGV